jgi:hypothetical protein
VTSEPSRSPGTGGDLTDDRDGDHVAAPRGSVHQLDAAGNLAVAANVAPGFQRLQVVIDDAGRGDPELGLNIADRGGVVVLIKKMLDVLEDRLLAAGQVFHEVAPLGSAASRGPHAPLGLAPLGEPVLP